MNKIILITLVTLLLINGVILTANIPKYSVYNQKTHLSTNDFFSTSLAEITTGITRDNHSFKSPYEHFEYDGLNRLTLAANCDSEVTFIYDKAGRLEREIQKIKETEAGIKSIAATYEVVYQHDDNNNKTQITYPSGKVINITPDALDRIDNIKENDNILVDYTYEGKGKIIRKNILNVITMEANFDDGRRPDNFFYNYKSNVMDVPLLSRGIDWNLTDLKKFYIESGKKEEYTYDSAFRLRNVNNKKNNIGYDYEIDEVENFNQITETINGIPKTKGTISNARHQFEQYNGMNLTYDNNGNLKHFTHDYIYNWKNQLIKVITGTGLNVEYKYDVLGRRIVKIVKAPESSDTIIRYIHDGYQVIEERDNNNKVRYRYTYGNGIDERIEMEKRLVDKTGNIEWKIYGASPSIEYSTQSLHYYRPQRPNLLNS